MKNFEQSLHKFISLYSPLIINYKSALNTNPTSFGIKETVAIFSYFFLLFSFLLFLHFKGWLDRCLPRAVAQSVNNLQQKLHITYMHIYIHIYMYLCVCVPVWKYVSIPLRLCHQLPISIFRFSPLKNENFCTTCGARLPRIPVCFFGIFCL